MNNFDQSSSGVNLELNISFDADRANRDFEDSFYVLQYNSYRQNSVLVFNQFGNFDVTGFDIDDSENYDPKSYTVKELKRILLEDGYHFKDVMNMRKCDMIQELSGNEVFQDFLKENAKPKFLVMESRGYSQGDYSQIIIPCEVLESYKDQTLEQIENVLQDVIDHLLWDQPLYARLTIDDEEFYIDEHLKDEYQYDQDEIKQVLIDHLEHEQKEYIIDWVVDNMPEQPECY